MAEQIDKLLNDWYRIKGEISRLEKDRDHIKKRVQSIIDVNSDDVLEGTTYQAKLNRNGKREYVSQKNVPVDVWDRYKSVTCFNTLSISKRKRSKSRSSIKRESK